jgi:hypothetical protein
MKGGKGMKYILRKQYPTGDVQYVAVRQGFQNHIDPNSVTFVPDLDLAARFDTQNQAALWQAVHASAGGRIEILQLAD